MAAVRAVQGASSAATARGERLNGRQAWRLLWASKPPSLGVLAWATPDAVDGPLVVGAVGFVVGAIPDAVRGGRASPAGAKSPRMT